MDDSSVEKLQEKFDCLSKEAGEVKKDNSLLKDEVKVWVQRKSQLTGAKVNVDDVSKTHGDDENYQEWHAIAQEFISGWSECIDDIQDCMSKCEQLEEHFEESIQKNEINANKLIDRFSELSGHSYSCGCFSLGFFSRFRKKTRTKNLFIETRNNLDRYQHEITTTKDKIREYREYLRKTITRLNQVRMGRTLAYGKQVQRCPACNKKYTFIKWCKFCDRDQFQKQFSKWETDHSEFDKIIRDSQLSIKYPNGYIQWIPYEKFADIEFVGKGAFAKVYKANWVEGLPVWDYALGKRVRYPNTPVALKELENSKNISKDFLEEVVAYVKSSSSTVLRCYGISRNPESKEYIMVFPYAHGGNLRKYVGKRLNWVNRLDILRHILYGLSDIHFRGLVHRDLHPGNLLHYRRTMSVSDLGLCRPTGDIDESERVYGVMPFIAPEVLRSKPYTQESDVYSIGIIMWFLISGHYPFSERKYDLELADKISNDTDPLRPPLFEGIPPDYQKLMQDCWDADPKKRPATKELYQKILSWLNEFNKDPLPDTVQQFLGEPEEPDNEYIIDDDRLASKPIPISAFVDYRHKDNKTIATNLGNIGDGNIDVNGDSNYEEDDEWNTIHVNDYQNWLYKLDLMRDYSEGKIASIVTRTDIRELPSFVNSRTVEFTNQETTSLSSRISYDTEFTNPEE